MNAALKLLAQPINTAIAEAREADGSERMAKCIEAGALLTQAADLLDPEDWVEWVEENLDAEPDLICNLVEWARCPTWGPCSMPWDGAVALYYMAVWDGWNSPSWPSRDDSAFTANGTWRLYNCNGLLAMVTKTGKVFDRPAGRRLDLVSA